MFINIAYLTLSNYGVAASNKGYAVSIFKIQNMTSVDGQLQPNATLCWVFAKTLPWILHVF